jgi:glutamate-1-semialdehyde 2,1-aminomutase
MQMGGIRRAGDKKLFLMSSTHGAESTGLAALMATIKAFKQYDMVSSNWARGELLMSRLNHIIREHKLENSLQILGAPCLFALVCRNSSGSIDDSYRTLFMQEMIARGVLFQGMFYPTWSHQDKEINYITKAFDESCALYRQAINSGSTANLLIGRPAKPVFRKII